MTHIVVAGTLANRPSHGSGAAVRMTWVAALRRLGFDTWFVEQVDRRLLAASARRPAAAPADAAPVRYFERVTRRHGLQHRAVLLDEEGVRLAGCPLEDLETAASDAALLINIDGHLRLRSLLDRFRFRAYLDLAPGFTQCRHAAGLGPGGLREHHLFFTVGLNVGREGCDLPTSGIHWRPLPPPVVLDQWWQQEGGLDAFTSVGAWRGTFGAVTHRGRVFGLRGDEFRRFLDLPGRLPAAPEIALEIHRGDAGDLEALERNGWRIVDPRRWVPDPEHYRDYVCSSGAELSVAQGIYVETSSGWFSDRTACYLAAGRPALVQDTGLSGHLPVGEGLVTFRTPDEAVAGAERIARDYERHRRSARQIAEQYLDSDRVVGRFCEQAGIAP